jgi:hypothetical protein
MGLTVHTSFVTYQGFSVSSVYVRLLHVIVPLPRLTVPTPTSSVYLEAYLTRDAYLASAAPLYVPGLPTSLTIRASPSDAVQHAVLYTHIKAALTEAGFSHEDVIEPAPEPTPEASPQSSESTPTTPPTPPPPSESQESSPEPQQPPSSEYAPAPAETEA